MRQPHEMSEQDKEDQRRMSGEGGHDPVLPPTHREKAKEATSHDPSRQKPDAATAKRG